MNIKKIMKKINKLDSNEYEEFEGDFLYTLSIDNVDEDDITIHIEKINFYNKLELIYKKLTEIDENHKKNNPNVLALETKKTNCS